MSMEGIEQNPVVYDLMSEMAFQQNKVDAKVMSTISFLTQIFSYFHMYLSKLPYEKF